MSWFGFPKYVSVAERREKAEKKIQALKKKGQVLHPISLTGRTIASTVWGKGWCKHLESLSDYENRLPRGRMYVRNGSIIDLQINQGTIKAMVQGSHLYNVTITISILAQDKWQNLVSECAGKIGSLIELLQGKFSQNVMEIITNKEKGLFPKSNDIVLNCSCPDYAAMCKHVAAVLYGVGARLDTKPEELFVLRSVDHLKLINTSKAFDALTKSKTSAKQLDENDLSSLFDIEIESSVHDKNVASKKTSKSLVKESNDKKNPKRPIKKLAKKKMVKPIKKSINVIDTLANEGKSENKANPKVKRTTKKQKKGKLL